VFGQDCTGASCERGHPKRPTQLTNEQEAKREIEENEYSAGIQQVVGKART
jgi:hypothetical protein